MIKTLSFSKAITICNKYETTGILCLISSDKNGNIELFTAINNETCSFVMSQDFYKYNITEELLRNLIEMSFENIKKRL
jgi:hypothetical protein